MPSIRFYLDRAATKLTNAGKPDCPVFLRYKQGKQSFVVYPDVFVHQHEWDKTSTRLSGRSLRVQQLNAQLSRAETSIHNIVERLRRENQGAAPSLHQVQVEAWKLYPPRRGENARLLAATQQQQREQQRQHLLELHQQKQTSLLDVIDWFLEQKRTTYQEGTLETYQSLRQNIVAYAKTFLPEHALHLSTLNRDFYVGFRNFLLSYQYRPGCYYVNTTINTRLKKIRALLNDLLTDGPEWMRRQVNPDYKHFRMLKDPSSSGQGPAREHLTGQEILLYYNYAFDHRSGRLARARDLYVFCYMTSLRLSDLRHIFPHHVYRKYQPDGSLVGELRLPMTQKSQKTLVIPLNGIALEILQRYAGKYRCSLPVIGKDTASRYVVEGLKRTGYFNELIEVVRLERNTRLSVVMPRYQALTFHTSRHGFATYLATEQVDIEDAQLLLGHSQLRTTSIYYRRDREDAAQRVRPVLQRLDQAYFTTSPSTPGPGESGSSTPLCLAKARSVET